ncbi:uncharacterized protein LOC117302940 [Asterias rubens]|uniref:uncharacterized protein LOC117302940 n=1 Tax=Asterias rubens TaxID=7604 RepID=UPI001455C9CD|nr:uncharacterized protein LOC117302940 [Asterias rubens]
MSSPTQVNTTDTPTTKRRFLGAARRKRPTSSVPFSPQQGTEQKFLTSDIDNLDSRQSTEDKQQTQTTDSCLSINDSTVQHGAQKRTLEGDSFNETVEKSSVLITPVRRGANGRKGLVSQNDNSTPSLRLKCLGETATSSLSSSCLDDQATPVQRLPVRNSLSGSARKRFRHDFKSPMRSNQGSSPKPAEQPDRAKSIESLQQTLEEIKTEIASLRNEGFCEDELRTHITKMHEYNELKDTGQMILGKIAMIDGVTTKDLYERFGLELND